MSARRVRVHFTADGVGLAVFCVALGGVALISGDNLLYLVLSVLLAIWIVGGIAGVRNVASVRVRRQLPDELFADRGARGAFVVSVGDGVPATALVLEERSWDGARVEVDRVVRTVRAETTWRPSRRGLRALGPVRVRSTWPFGLLEHVVDLDVDDAVWVWPRPGPPAEATEAHGASQHLPSDEPDELVDLRPYRPGDRLRDVHWPTTARTGTPMVAVRAGVGAAPVWVRVPALTGPALEDAISAATGAVLDATAAGRPVGLVVANEVMPPRSGPAWRRQLLSVLATIPEGGR
ncbi:MAG: DUF58 domain-containing protein [Alphaproteobacteria bacterium]|nr:DUF58 domain-containing protein [Alphaproteobacteria bacterium]